MKKNKILFYTTIILTALIISSIIFLFIAGSVTRTAYITDFSRIFSLKTTVFRHSSMYGSRQFATYDQGWIGWFCQKSIEKKHNNNVKPFEISSTGKQVRDILHANDMINLYYTAIQYSNKTIGKAYNIGGSMKESMSLLELFNLLNKLLNIELEYTKSPFRISDQKVFVADISKIHNDIGWAPDVSAEEGIKNMLKWIDGGLK